MRSEGRLLRFLLTLVVFSLASALPAAQKDKTRPPAPRDGKPLIRKDLLTFSGGEIVPPRRDIFRPMASAQPASPQVLSVKAPAQKGRGPADEPPAFALNLVYIGSVRAAGKIVALVLKDGQTISVAEGDEIIPGYKVLRVTPDEIEIGGPSSERKTFARQGDRP